ncbi:uncharacterized protein LOC133878966 [Alnus glutinosa]|uniref:uncharacterized protein LOC133878966 n=1 Tax=Alnus glutinosa TaxID=3517 RepID=UPI002D79458C|nr:uncharacterized protein LOC133878966 [Alnus glutinosa]
MAAVASILAIGAVILEDIRSKRLLRREPHVNQEYERGIYMDSILYGSKQDCIDQIRMSPTAFFELCKILADNNLIRETINMSIKEQVLMFLHIIGHNVRFRVDCVGAIDGTHVRASVPIEIQGRFRGRKERTTQNVLAGIIFDLKFTYVLAGWEGSAHDSRVLNDALTGPEGFKIPEGKYYLGDAGYGTRNGIISPYRGVRYHLKEFEPFWSFPTQVDVVLACCVIHNHIMGVDPNDSIMEEVVRDVGSQNQSAMGKNKEKDTKNKQFRWSKPMHTLLLEILANEAVKGNKPSNTFKPASFALVARSINEKFGVECASDHVENRLRTIRNMWTSINTLQWEEWLWMG